MKIFTLVTLVVTLVFGPFTVSGALSSLPIGSKEKVVEYTTQVDFVALKVWVSGEVSETQIYNQSFGRFTSDDGRTETFYAMSRRSRADFEKTLSFMMKVIVSDLLKQSAEGTLLDMGGAPISLENRNLELGYDGMKMRDTVRFYPFFNGRNQGAVARNSLGELELPEDTFKLDLATTVLELNRVTLLVPKIDKAQVIIKDEYGTALQILDGSSEYDVEGVQVSARFSVVSMPTYLAISNTLGEFRVWHTNGVEQVFDLSNGSNLITYLTPAFAESSPFRRLGVPKVTEKGIELPYESTDSEEVLVEVSTDLNTWVSYPYLLPTEVRPPVSPTSVKASSVPPVRVRTAVAPKVNGHGFYRARVISPIASAQVLGR